MENLPDGAKCESSAPYNQKEYNNCALCGGDTIFQDSGEVNVNNRIVDWVSTECTECGNIHSEEPDFY